MNRWHDFTDAELLALSFALVSVTMRDTEERLYDEVEAELKKRGVA